MKSFGSHTPVDRSRGDRLSWSGTSGLETQIDEVVRFRSDNGSKVWNDGDIPRTEPAAHADHELSKEESEHHMSHHMSLRSDLTSIQGHGGNDSHHPMNEVHMYKEGTEGHNEPLRRARKRGGGLVIREGDNDAQTSIDKIHSLGTATSNPIPRDARVWRGIRKASGMQAMAPGTTFHDNAFTGTSFRRGVASGFADSYGSYDQPENRKHLKGHFMVAQIHVPRGTLAHYPDIDPNGSHSHEKELILHRGTSFRVLGHSLTTSEDGERKFHVVHMEVTGQHPKSLHPEDEEAGTRLVDRWRQRNQFPPKPDKSVYPLAKAAAAESYPNAGDDFHTKLATHMMNSPKSAESDHYAHAHAAVSKIDSWGGNSQHNKFASSYALAKDASEGNGANEHYSSAYKAAHFASEKTSPYTSGFYHHNLAKSVALSHTASRPSTQDAHYDTAYKASEKMKPGAGADHHGSFANLYTQKMTGQVHGHSGDTESAHYKAAYEVSKSEYAYGGDAPHHEAGMAAAKHAADTQAHTQGDHYLTGYHTSKVTNPYASHADHDHFAQKYMQKLTAPPSKVLSNVPAASSHEPEAKEQSPHYKAGYEAAKSLYPYASHDDHHKLAVSVENEHKTYGSDEIDGHLTNGTEAHYKAFGNTNDYSMHGKFGEKYAQNMKAASAPHKEESVHYKAAYHASKGLNPHSPDDFHDQIAKKAEQIHTDHGGTSHDHHVQNGTLASKIVNKGSGPQHHLEFGSKYAQKVSVLGG